MPTVSTQAHSDMYRLEECQDIMSDACVCDDLNQLIFLSLWGRDTAVLQFLARLELGPTEKDGLDQFHLVTPDHTSLPVAVPDTDRLQKVSTRSYPRTLFGSMIHTWLFDVRCIRPDKANASALAILPKGSANRTQRIWALVQDTCPLPLLPHWRDIVLSLLEAHSMLVSLPFALGPVEGVRIALDIPVLTAAIGDRIRSAVLRIDADEQDSLLTLDRVARQAPDCSSNRSLTP